MACLVNSLRKLSGDILDDDKSNRIREDSDKTQDQISEEQNPKKESLEYDDKNDILQVTLDDDDVSPKDGPKVKSKDDPKNDPNSDRDSGGVDYDDFYFATSDEDVEIDEILQAVDETKAVTSDEDVEIDEIIQAVDEIKGNGSDDSGVDIIYDELDKFEKGNGSDDSPKIDSSKDGPMDDHVSGSNSSAIDEDENDFNNDELDELAQEDGADDGPKDGPKDKPKYDPKDSLNDRHIAAGGDSDGTIDSGGQ